MKNKKIRKALPIVAISVMCMSSFVMGGLNMSSSFAATGALNTVNAVWSGGEEKASTTVLYTGDYLINVCGGGAASGGNISGMAALKKGDVLETRVFAGGAGGGGEQGSPAILMYLNGLPLIGAGGAGGTSYCSNPPDGYSNTTLGNPVVEFDNARFSSGGGGSYAKRRDSTVGQPGNTIDGAVKAAPGSVWSNGTYTHCGGGTAGTNYLDVDRINLTEQPNDSTKISFKVTQKKATAEEQWEYMRRQTLALEGINDKMAEASDSSQVVSLCTVIAGKPFDEYMAGDDKTVGGELDGLTIINNNSKDGLVRAVGILNDVGAKQISIDGRLYTFKVISEPNSGNVSAILN